MCCCVYKGVRNWCVSVCVRERGRKRDRHTKQRGREREHCDKPSTPSHYRTGKLCVRERGGTEREREREREGGDREREREGGDREREREREREMWSVCVRAMCVCVTTLWKPSTQRRKRTGKRVCVRGKVYVYLYEGDTNSGVRLHVVS